MLTPLGLNLLFNPFVSRDERVLKGKRHAHKYLKHSWEDEAAQKDQPTVKTAQTT